MLRNPMQYKIYIIPFEMVQHVEEPVTTYICIITHLATKVDLCDMVSS